MTHTGMNEYIFMNILFIIVLKFIGFIFHQTARRTNQKLEQLYWINLMKYFKAVIQKFPILVIDRILLFYYPQFDKSLRYF